MSAGPQRVHAGSVRVGSGGCVVVAASLAAWGLCCAAGLSGCVEERVVQVRGGLYGLPGAQSQRQAGERLGASTVSVQGVVDQFYGGRNQLEIGEPVEGWPNRRMLDDGSLYLISRSPGELIRHLYETTIDGDWELMYDQLIAEEAKDNYRQANRDPMDIIRFLRENRVEFVALLRLMGNGENTPGVDFIPLGPQRYRLNAPSAKEFDQRFSTMDMVLEEGRMVLLVIK